MPAPEAIQLFSEAFRLHESGDLAGAEVLYRQVLISQPDHTQALYLLGTLESQHGDYVHAHEHLSAALAQRPDWPEALSNLGLVLCGLGHQDEAEPMLRRALALCPDYPYALNNLAGVVDSRGQVEEAVTLYRRALELKPDYVDAHNNLGLLLKQLHRLEEAAHSFERAMVINPNHFDACNNLAVVLNMLDRQDEAEQRLRRALQLRPDSYNAHNNLAAVLQAQCRFEEAMAEYDQALRLRPDDSLIQWNRAFILLALGNLQAGWEAYEWRRPVFNWQPLPFTEWDGASLAGKTILVFAEQGLGDELLFASCFPDLLALAAHCIFECDPRLAPLYWRSFPGATVMGVRRTDREWIHTLPPIDVQIPAGSLTRYLRSTLASFPARPGYLVADAVARAHWRARLASFGPGILVGITWRSGLTKEGRHRNYSRLNDWGAIFAIPGVQFINLQYDDCAEELTAVHSLFGVEVHTFPELDLFNNLDGAAALISALDLVIAAGNATGEIAAALGLPVWRLEPHGWPWTSLGTETFPWHPRMRVFRQQISSEWDEILKRVATQLMNFTAEGQPALSGVAPDRRTPTILNSNQDPLQQAISNLEIGNHAWAAGHAQDAEDCYRQALSLAPHLAEAHNNLGSVLFGNGQLADAERSYRAALTYRAEFPQAHYNLANVLYKCQRREEALVEYQIALDQHPDYADAYNNLGRTFQEMGRMSDAEAALERAITLAPDLPEAHNNLATLRYGQGRLEEALSCYRHALALQPRFAIALYNLANVLRELGHVEEALVDARLAIEQDPSDLKATLILGDVLQDLNRFEEALPCYNRVLATAGLQNPELGTETTLSEALRNRAFCLLAAGDLTRGWAAYAIRSALLKPLPLNCPVLDDGAALTSKTVLVLPEQGLGDEILFASCLPDLINATGHCIVECDPRLISLYARSFPTATITPNFSLPLQEREIDFQTRERDRLQEREIDFQTRERDRLQEREIDFQTLIGDLPRYLRTSWERFPTTAGYLIPDPVRVAASRERLATLGTGLKVGITWRSGLLNTTRRRHYTELTQWAPVLAVSGVIFVNLQYDDCAAELALIHERCGVKIHAFADLNLKDDLEEAAALSAALDLVIGAGNAATELASALGLTVWRLEAQGRSWTSLGTTAMPWHPLVKLFKQRRWGDWEPVFAALATQLSLYVECGTQGLTHDSIMGISAFAPVTHEERSEEISVHSAFHHGHLANALASAGRGDEAEAAYRTALQLNPYWSQAHNDLGNLLRAHGRVAEAERCYLTALHHKPDLVEAHNNLGTLLEQQDRIAEAETAYRAALRLRPHFPEGWYNLGNCLSDLGRWTEAETAYREALVLRPDYALAWFYLGMARTRLNQPTTAEDAYRQALALRPAWSEAINALANLITVQKRWHEAEVLYREALATTPNSHELYSNLGSCLQAQGRSLEAEDAYREALRLSPRFAAAWNNLGNTLRALGRVPEGLAAFQEALICDPDFADAHSNLANALRENGVMGDAEAHDRQAVALDPNLAGAWVNLGNTLRSNGRLKDAEDCFRRALTLGWEEAVLHLGQVLYEQGQPQAAIECLADRVRCHPDDQELRWNLSLPLLAQGNLELGWAAFEWGRYPRIGQGRYRNLRLPFPEWDGGSLEGKTILVYAEQGVGDEILFASCLPDLLGGLPTLAGGGIDGPGAGHCIIECDQRLAALYIRSFPNATVIGTARDDQSWVAELGVVDIQVPVGSLPHFLRRRIADFPNRAGYLIPDPEQQDIWRTRIQGPGLRVGITWRSRLTAADRSRHYSSLNDWEKIFAIPGVTWVNLQSDDLSREELALLRDTYRPELDLFNDLDGAAALLSTLDIVIAAGNATGEIAAAVGIPVWRLEPYGRPWTSLGTESFPWHPRMRVFRQSTPGDWDELLGRVAEALTREIAKIGTHEIRKLLDQGREHQERDELDAAARCCEEALHLDVTSAVAYNDLGNVRLKQGELTTAEECYRHALHLLPDYAETWNNLGSLMGKKNLITEAITCYQTALDLRPELFEARYNLASLLQDDGEPVVAEQHFRYALRQGADNALLWNGLALAVRDQGRLEEALTCFAEAQRHSPNDARINWNMGLTYLAQGDLTRGWDGFEWGYRTMGRCSREFEFPEWDGRPLLDGTLLIYAEQGVGDEVLFASCLPDLLTRVGCCVIECEPRLGALFTRSFPQAEVHGVMRTDRDWLAELGSVDFQCPIGSLSYYLRRNLDSFPRSPGYLLPDPGQRSAWRQRIRHQIMNKKSLKVGISWRSRLVGSGRARFYSRLIQWGAVFAVPNVVFINLQYDDCTAELSEVSSRLGVEIIQFPEIDLLNDLDGVAALASALDLVIAPPNAIAELAAAVGTEVWRLDAALPNWLALGTDFMPWHPTMRFFRQEQLGEWDDVLQTLAQSLEQRVTQMELWGASPPIPRPHQERQGLGAAAGQLLAGLIKRGGMVVQIGAGDGTITHALAQAVGETGKVIVWEERPGPFRRLQALITSHNLSCVQCRPEQMGARMGELPAWRACPWDLLMSTNPEADCAWATALVPCRTVDSLDLSGCDLLAMDAEGREMEILAGAWQTLARYRPLLSLGRYRHEVNTGLIALLDTHGYRSLIQDIVDGELILLAYPLV